MVLPVLERRRQRFAALPDRILLGSGYPNIAYPYLDVVDSILNLDLGDDWARAVLNNNAAGPFHLGTATGCIRPGSPVAQS